MLLAIFRHDFRTAWRVRQYWRRMHADAVARGEATGRAHLPCVWCVHDTQNYADPVWLWCIRPSRPTADRWGDEHYLGCNWGNE